MVNQLKKRKFLVGLAVTVLLGLLAYAPLVHSYFIQDEWVAFSRYYSLSENNPVHNLLFLISPQIGQYVPIEELVSYSIFSLIKLNYIGFFLFGIFLHAAVGLMLGLLMSYFIKKPYPIFLGILFFLVDPTLFQVTSWFEAYIGYGLSAVLFLTGLLSFFYWLEDARIKKAILSSLFLTLSVLTKEITVFIFIALPIVTYIWSKKPKRVFQAAGIVSPVFLFALWQYLFLKFHPIGGLSVQGTLIPLNIFLLPVKSLAQSTIPQDWIYSASRLMTFWVAPRLSLQPNTTAFELFAETKMVAAVIFLIILIVLILGFLLHRLSSKNKEYLLCFKLYETGVILTALSGLPYIFVDTQDFTLLQPRYTYIGVLSICLSLSALFYVAYQKWGKKMSVLPVVILLIFGYAIFTMSAALAKQGEIRQNILMNIASAIPQNSKVTLVYTDSDSSFYGLPDSVHILPFQNGVGKTLSVYLHDRAYVPKALYDPDTLWELTSQGYYQDVGGGFGYFSSYPDLLEAVKKYRVAVNNIYAFSYLSYPKRLVDITSQVRSNISQDMVYSEHTK